MIPPTLLLRDTSLVGVGLCAGALLWGPGVAVVVAVGAAAAVLNLALLVLASFGMVRGGVGAALMPMKLLLAIGLVGALTAFFPPLPVLAGFAAGPLAMLLRGLAGMGSIRQAEPR